MGTAPAQRWIRGRSRLLHQGRPPSRGAPGCSSCHWVGKGAAHGVYLESPVLLDAAVTHRTGGTTLPLPGLAVLSLGCTDHSHDACGATLSPASVSPAVLPVHTDSRPGSGALPDRYRGRHSWKLAMQNAVHSWPGVVKFLYVQVLLLLLLFTL